MSETKDDIAAERDQLRAANEQLRGQLAAAGATRGTAPAVQHQFVLSEGQRQELIQYGNTQVDGRMLGVADVETLLGDDQHDVLIPEPENVRPVPAAQNRPKQPGVDFIYPSVAYGKLDPAVAGTPGVSGPAAGE